MLENYPISRQIQFFMVTHKLPWNEMHVKSNKYGHNLLIVNMENVSCKQIEVLKEMQISFQHNKD